MPKEAYERVNHPKHYNSHPSGIECIDVVEHYGFNLGNAIKYLWRAGLKPDEATLADLKKAQWYVTREISKIEKRVEAERRATEDRRVVKSAGRRSTKRRAS